MRVMLTTDTVGGVWTFTNESTQQLLAQGHSVALVSFGRAASTTQNVWAEDLAATFPDKFVFRECEAPLEWMQDNASTWDEGAALLTHVAEEFRPDILHSSQFCWGALPLAVPKVITAHSDVRSWAAACRSDGLMPSPWLDRYDSLVQNGIKGADALIAPTAWMRDALRMHFEVSAAFPVIPNGRGIPYRGIERARELRAVSVGRLWDEGKGLAALKGIVLPMPVLLAGEACFEGAAGGGFGNRVTALGTLDEESLFALFATSSVYLATSLYEPFGLAPLEAALCGCAVVARDLPSFREVWGDAAVYFTDGDGLQSILTALVNNPAKLRTARDAAGERARFFTSKRMAASYVSLYRELIAGRSVCMAEREAETYAA